MYMMIICLLRCPAKGFCWHSTTYHQSPSYRYVRCWMWLCILKHRMLPVNKVYTLVLRNPKP